MGTKRIATFVEPAEGFWGEAAVYRMSPPLEGYEYVVASSVGLSNVFPDSETMVFPWDETAKCVLDWGDLAVVAEWSHAAVFESVGYEMVGA